MVIGLEQIKRMKMMTDEEFYNQVIKPVIYNLLTGNNTRLIEPGEIKQNKTAKNIKYTNVKLLTIDTPKELIEPIKRLQNAPHIVFINSSDTKVKNILYVKNKRFICFVVVLHWFYKKRFNSKHRIPCRKTFSNIFEPYGALYTALFNLCSEVHILIGKKNISVFQWFESILFELRNDWRFSPVPLIAEVTTKAEDIKKLTKEVIDLKHGKNIINKSKHPNLYELIKESIRLSESKVFVDFKDIWQEYITAYDRCINVLKLPEVSKLGCDEDGNLYIVNRRGEKITSKIIPIG